MSIEIGLLKPLAKEKLILGHIIPGELSSFSDFSTGQRQTISAHCLGDDTGGEVYLFDNDGFPELSGARIIPIEYYVPKNILATIESGGKFEKPILTETRHAGRLLLTHLQNKSN